MYALMRLTLDTNILISSLMTEDTPPALLYRAWKNERFSLITSKEQLAELTRVLAYPKLKPFINPFEARELVAGLAIHAIIASGLPVISHSSDPSDNIILATAIKGHCNFLVTGDKKDLLALKKIEEVSIITARTAIEILEKPAFDSGH